MPSPLLLALVGVFGLVALVFGSVTSWALARASPAQRRLREAARSSSDTTRTSETLQLLEKPTPRIARLSRALPTQSPQELSRLRRRLAQAGYREIEALVWYRGSAVLAPIALGLLAFLIAGSRSEVWLIVGFAVAMGFFLPGLVLDYKVAQRKKLLRNGLPDALDLIIVCVEAGASLDQGIGTARDELQLSHPDLADELRQVTLEMQAGQPRIQALRNFAERTKVDDIRSLVAILAQTERFGTNVAQALRTQADTSRTKRRQRAEEKAQKLGVKLVFPLVFCLFPAFYVVTLGPAAVQYMNVIRADLQ